MSKNPSEKIVSREVLAKIVQDLKERGAVIVTTNGSFDLLHIGHVTMLQEAKSLGDVLIVGVNSDTSVKRYKGKYRPICLQEQRAEMLAALACTDYITIFDELTPLELLEMIQPNIHVNSPEHGYECIEREVVERYGGRIYLSRLVAGMSTSQLISRIIEVSSQESCRAIFLNSKNLFESFTPHEDILNVLKQFCDLDFRLFLLAYHPEIALGQRTEEEVRTMYSQLQEEFHQHRIEISQMYLCPHDPDGTVDVYRLTCACRSPKPGLLEKAVAEFNVSLARSFIISGEMTDIEMGRAVNCKTIFLTKRGHPKEHNLSSLGPNYTIEGFQEAASLLMKIR